MNKLGSAIILLSTVFLAACSDLSTTLPPSGGATNLRPKMETIYKNVSNHQQAYIRSQQLPTGAIKDNEQSNSRINPYFANFASMALLTKPTNENLRVVQKYMLWYMGKLNGNVNPVTGKPEIEGSIYDYYCPGETTKGTYDSIDSYAATFLELVKRYAQVSPENLAWLKTYKDKISLVARAMVRMIDTERSVIPGNASIAKPDSNDYLSVASFVYPEKYLMDNCEVNMGLRAAKWLKDNGLLTSKEDFGKILAKNTAAIESLYKGSTYNWALKQRTNWNVFYADAVAQLYPSIFDVAVSDADRADRLYNKFNQVYSGWEDGKTFDNFPWAIISYAAAKVNDVDRVESYIKHINSLNEKGQQKDRWYSAEAAFVILAIDRVSHP